MINIMFVDHYIGWEKSRIEGVKKYVKPDFLKKKTLFEVGGGYGNNGNLFQELGCIVTSSDARIEHIEIGKEKYKNIKFTKFDCDKETLSKKYDIILHWGVLYHLNVIDDHMKNMCENCDYLFLETEVCDSDDPTLCLKTNESGFDQAFHGVGSRPSQKYVEAILDRHGFTYKLIKDPIVNSSFHNYDWDVKNTNTWRHGLRRFWICWKNDIESPLMN